MRVDAGCGTGTLEPARREGKLPSQGRNAGNKDCAGGKVGVARASAKAHPASPLAGNAISFLHDGLHLPATATVDAFRQASVNRHGRPYD